MHPGEYHSKVKGLRDQPLVRQGEEISISTLLNEMVDREQLICFPENGFKCLQASSYNRESVSPDKPGWFADSDGIGYIRIEENKGQKEWVIMEDDGPGVITKIWAVCFYYGLNDTTGANIKVYLDGESEPVIHTCRKSLFPDSLCQELQDYHG